MSLRIESMKIRSPSPKGCRAHYRRTTRAPPRGDDIMLDGEDHAAGHRFVREHEDLGACARCRTDPGSGYLRQPLFQGHPPLRGKIQRRLAHPLGKVRVHRTVFCGPGRVRGDVQEAVDSPISTAALAIQVQERQLTKYELVEVLGGSDYAERVRAAFAGSSVKIACPIEGLRLGEGWHRVKRALLSDEPLTR